MIFRAKIREVGTSLGMLIPKNAVNEQKLRNGEEIEVCFLKKDIKGVEKLFGIAGRKESLVIEKKEIKGGAGYIR